MVRNNVTLVLMVGGWRASPVGDVLRAAHQAAARDLLDDLLGTGLIGSAVVATDDKEWGESLSCPLVEVDVDPPGKPFHFGQRLASIIERCGAQAVLYSGGGSAPLMNSEAWYPVLERLVAADQLVITNNVHSCDWVGFVPAGHVLPLVAEQERDNAVAWALSREVGLPLESLAPSAAARFDLDTPLDLLIARRHRATGSHLDRFLENLDWASDRLDAVASIMEREGGSLVIAGRVPSAAWVAVEQATQCWIRVFSEERGMRASGRQARGEVRSLIADYLRLVGVDGLFSELATLADGVILDNRVILAARGIWPSASDRYYADLLRWDSVEEPFLRRMTWAAAQAAFPVVMGGHSVVSGGLLALVETIQGREKAR
ncbi:MAG: hypothetical protein GX620_06735 [Chloroflexi bacterium]|nr:hypothetical protein [Chloroflexota bacterium]